MPAWWSRMSGRSSRFDPRGPMAMRAKWRQALRQRRAPARQATAGEASGATFEREENPTALGHRARGERRDVRA
jgi:hypothetical protein